MNKFSGICIEWSNEPEGKYSKLAKGRSSKVMFVKKGDNFDLDEGFFEVEYERTEVQRENKKPKNVNLVIRIIKHDPDFEDYLSKNAQQYHGM